MAALRHTISVVTAVVKILFGVCGLRTGVEHYGHAHAHDDADDEVRDSN